MRIFDFKKRNIILPLLILFGSTVAFSEFDTATRKSLPDENRIYDQMHLSQIGLNEDVFQRAVAGWKLLVDQHRLVHPGILSIADFSQSANAKRLFVLDMENHKVLFNTWVAHGRNSGDEFATSFSNRPESYQSSLGFYVTQGTYEGRHGLSMKLLGLEAGINDAAAERGIVMHGAPYVSKNFIDQYGRLGRSQGCPAVPEDVCSPIVNSIKEGSCFFAFYPDSNYLKNSDFFHF